MNVTERIEFHRDGGSTHTWASEDGSILRREVFRSSPVLFTGTWPPKTANEAGVSYITRWHELPDEERKA